MSHSTVSLIQTSICTVIYSPYVNITVMNPDKIRVVNLKSNSRFYKNSIGCEYNPRVCDLAIYIEHLSNLPARKGRGAWL